MIYWGYEWPPNENGPEFSSNGDSQVDAICDVFLALSRAAAEKK